LNLETLTGCEPLKVSFVMNENVVITNSSGKVITTVGGNTRSLKTWKDVTKMLNNQGGFSSLPQD